MIRERESNLTSGGVSPSPEPTGWTASLASWAMRPVNVTTKQLLLITVSALCAINFLPGFYFTGRLVAALEGYRVRLLLFSLPYAGLWFLFVASLILSLRKRLRLSAVLLCVGVIASAALCFYDLTHSHRAQITGFGHSPIYFFWFRCYYEPFWYGYKPGNV